MKQYDFVCVNGWYALTRTGYPHVEVWGIGSKDRKVEVIL